MTFNIFIPGEVPSSKNSKQWTGTHLVSSKTTQTYIRNTAKDYEKYAESFIQATNSLPKPLKISFLFVRGSKRRFDYINPLQTVQDLMVKHGWLKMIIPMYYYQYYYYTNTKKKVPGYTYQSLIRFGGVIIK